MTEPIRLVVVALGTQDLRPVVGPVLAAARAQALAAGGRLVEPAPVLAPQGAQLGDLGRVVPVRLPRWADAVPVTSAAGPRGAAQRILAENTGALAGLLASWRDRALLGQADLVVAADRRSELAVWSLRGAARPALTTGGAAMSFALGELLGRA